MKPLRRAFTVVVPMEHFSHSPRLVRTEGEVFRNLCILAQRRMFYSTNNLQKERSRKRHSRLGHFLHHFLIDLLE